MNKLQINTGQVTYTLNDACEITYNPTDAAFVERLYEAFDTLDKRQEEYRKGLENIKEGREAFAFLRERDTEMRECIDGLLGAPVCEALFGQANVYALADGLPLWCNLLLAIMDTIDTSIAKEQQTTSSKVEKYLKKYRR